MHVPLCVRRFVGRLKRCDDVPELSINQSMSGLEILGRWVRLDHLVDSLACYFSRVFYGYIEYYPCKVLVRLGSGRFGCYFFAVSGEIESGRRVVLGFSGVPVQGREGGGG